jgi:hypothetical protein
MDYDAGAFAVVMRLLFYVHWGGGASAAMFARRKPQKKERGQVVSAPRESNPAPGRDYAFRLAS